MKSLKTMSNINPLISTKFKFKIMLDSLSLLVLLVKAKNKMLKKNRKGIKNFKNHTFLNGGKKKPVNPQNNVLMSG